MKLVTLMVALLSILCAVPSYAAKTANTKQQACTNPLAAFQNKISRGLQMELKTAPDDKVLTVFFLVPQAIAEANNFHPELSFQAPLAERLQLNGLELVNVSEPTDGKVYIKARGPKHRMEPWIQAIQVREEYFKRQELEWAGLRMRVTQSATPTGPSRYVVMFETQKHFEEAQTTLQSMAVSTLDHYVRAPSGTVVTLLESSSDVLQQIKGIAGVTSAEPEVVLQKPRPPVKTVRQPKN